MSKLILSLLFLVVGLSAGNLFSTLSGMTWDEKKTVHYTIDTAGFNPRVYEFQPTLVKNYICIVIFPNADGKHVAAVPAMQCIKKK